MSAHRFPCGWAAAIQPTPPRRQQSTLTPRIVRAEGEQPLFAQGDRVRITMRFPVGHYRVPSYLRGRRGSVEKVIEPAGIDNEEEGFGRNAGTKRHYYRVVIPLSELSTLKSSKHGSKGVDVCPRIIMTIIIIRSISSDRCGCGPWLLRSHGDRRAGAPHHLALARRAMAEFAGTLLLVLVVVGVGLNTRRGSPTLGVMAEALGASLGSGFRIEPWGSLL
jgi:hypothetical protein